MEAVGQDDRRRAGQAVPGHHSRLRICGVVPSTDVFCGIYHDVGTILKNGGRGSMRFELQKPRWKKVLISILLEMKIFEDYQVAWRF